MAEAQAKTVSMYVAAQAGMWMDLKKGERNPLLEAAKAISFTGEKSREELELEAMRGPVVAADWRDDPRLQTEDPAKRAQFVRVGPEEDDVVPRWVVDPDIPQAMPGSYEALMSGWSGPFARKAFQTEGHGE